jgi:hypothetical protein
MLDAGMTDGDHKGAPPSRTTGTEPVDVKLRYARARKLLHDGAFDEATTEFVWLWQHMLEHDMAMVGVRLSFMASLLTTLTAKHPPARERFTALRDSLGILVEAGSSSWMQLQDWAVLSKVLGETDRVVEWFDRQGAGYDLASQSARVMTNQLVPLLQAKGRWADIGRLYSEPLQLVQQQYKMVTDIPRLTAGQPESAAEISRSIEQHFLSRVAELYAALRAAGREADSQVVLDEARRLMPGDALEAAVAGTLKDAGLAEPT